MNPSIGMSGERGAWVRLGRRGLLVLWLAAGVASHVGCTGAVGVDIPIPVPLCGDGILDTSAGEVCDHRGASETCDQDCTLAECGDGIFNPLAGELCDDRGDSARCNANCTPAVCGDKYVNPAAGEACDAREESARCDGDCSLAMCGDGHVNPLAGERCDDGDGDDGDACTTACREARCGDGLVHVGIEECDDGDQDDTDSCMSTCVAASCTDDLHNGDETDLDCGGACGASCGSGLRCSSHDDCFSGSCGRGACASVKLAAGHAHTCVVLDGGLVRCWGHNDYGQLGYGNMAAIGDDELPSRVRYVDVGGVVVQIAAGWYHTCALLAGGALRCWGGNGGGQLGLGHTQSVGATNAPSSAGDVDAGGRVVQVVAGGGHTCALLEGGTVRCWGSNYDGQLGYGHQNRVGDDEVPSSVGTVDVGGRVVQLVAGVAHTCALLEDGRVRCWGGNWEGQLGYGHWYGIGDDEVPRAAGDVPVGGRVVQLAAGSAHTCALREDGRVKCWGSNWVGQLGQGHTEPVGDDEVPSSTRDADAGGRVVWLVAGGEHTCALREDGAVRCWGNNEHGQLGLGHTRNVGDDEAPRGVEPVDLGVRALDVTAGGQHTCVLLESGALRCWGRNWEGQLGLGHTRPIGDDELPGSADPVSYR